MHTFYTNCFHHFNCLSPVTLQPREEIIYFSVDVNPLSEVVTNRKTITSTEQSIFTLTK